MCVGGSGQVGLRGRARKRQHPATLTAAPLPAPSRPACPPSRPAHLRADLLRVGAQGLEHAGGHALALAQQAQQDVLGANVVVACRCAHVCMCVGWVWVWQGGSGNIRGGGAISGREGQRGAGEDTGEGGKQWQCGRAALRDAWLASQPAGRQQPAAKALMRAWRCAGWPCSAAGSRQRPPAAASRAQAGIVPVACLLLTHPAGAPPPATAPARAWRAA